MRWIKNLIVGALQKRTNTICAESVEELNKLLPELECVSSRHPEFYNHFLELCEANNIKNPPKFGVIVKPHIETGLNEHSLPMAFVEGDAILVGSELLDRMVAHPVQSMSVFAHELGHIIRRDIQPPGLHFGTRNKGLIVDFSGAHKTMEQSTDALGAHMMMKLHKGDRMAGMDVARYANGLAEGSQQAARSLGRQGSWAADIARDLNALHYGTPAQRLDNVRRAVRIDHDKHATHLDRLIAERNASGLGGDIKR